MNMDVLSRVFNILQRVGGMEQIGQFMTIVYGIVCVFGILNCLLGYRILRFWMMIFGFLIGAGAGFGVTYLSGVEDKMVIAGAGGAWNCPGYRFISCIQSRNFCTGIWHRNFFKHLSGASDQFFFLLPVYPCGSGTWYPGDAAMQKELSLSEPVSLAECWQGFLLRRSVALNSFRMALVWQLGLPFLVC